MVGIAWINVKIISKRKNHNRELEDNLFNPTFLYRKNFVFIITSILSFFEICF
jgi:hypothetical protein